MPTVASIVRRSLAVMKQLLISFIPDVLSSCGAVSTSQTMTATAAICSQDMKTDLSLTLPFTKELAWHSKTVCHVV